MNMRSVETSRRDNVVAQRLQIADHLPVLGPQCHLLSGVKYCVTYGELQHEWKASHADVMTGGDHSTNHKCVATAARSRCRTRGTRHVSRTRRQQAADRPSYTPDSALESSE